MTNKMPSLLYRNHNGRERERKIKIEIQRWKVGGGAMIEAS